MIRKGLIRRKTEQATHQPSSASISIVLEKVQKFLSLLLLCFIYPLQRVERNLHCCNGYKTGLRHCSEWVQSLIAPLLLSKYPLETYKRSPPPPPSYRRNSTISVLQQKGHWITHEALYAIKQRNLNQTKSRRLTLFCFCFFLSCCYC